MNEISQQSRSSLSMFDVSGTGAVITGASGAFGRGVALALASMGGGLCLSCGSQHELDAVAAEVAELGGDCVTIRRRPDSLEDAEAIRDKALAAFGQIDQLVIAPGFNRAGFNRAGFNMAGFIHDQPLEECEQVMDANLRGNGPMAKAVGGWWIANEVKGKMLMISSVRGRHGNISGYTGSCTSKGATARLPGCLRPNGPGRASPSTPSRPGCSAPGAPPGCGPTTRSARPPANARGRAFRWGGSARSKTSPAWRSTCSRRHLISAPGRSCISTAATRRVGR